MLVIPAIDLKGGRCVRLRQGRMEDETVYSEEPAMVAVKWVEAGAEWIHLVDLDGAVAGRAVNREAVLAIRKAVGCRLQLGGGIRGIDAIAYWLGSGIDRVILGTAAAKAPTLVAEACRLWPGRVAVGIDALHGEVMVKGWQEGAARLAVDLAKEMQGYGVAAIILTDVGRDGVGGGINEELAKEVGSVVDTPIIVSGGIATLADIKVAMRLSSYGVIGVITGRAIYEGTLDLAEAIQVARGV